MKRQIKYISELNRSFDTPEQAIEDDNRLPGIIATYEADLARMEAGEEFAGRPPNDELKDQWRRAIAIYKENWAAAKASLENVKRMRHYQRERKSHTGLMVELGKIIETERLVVVAWRVLFAFIILLRLALRHSDTV